MSEPPAAGCERGKAAGPQTTLPRGAREERTAGAQSPREAQADNDREGWGGIPRGEPPPCEARIIIDEGSRAPIPESPSPPYIFFSLPPSTPIFLTFPIFLRCFLVLWCLLS